MTSQQPIQLSWYQSLSLQGALLIILMTLSLLAGVLYVVNSEGKPAVLHATGKHIEQLGNNIVERLHGRSLEIAGLVRSIATGVALLPKQQEVFMQRLPPLYDFGGDLAIAGGGVWPEPYVFEAATERRSFFWGRNKLGKFIYFDDYNAPEGKGYLHEEWYVTSRYLPPNRCFWSKSYMDPYSFQPMVTCTVGWFEQGRFSGTATVDLKLEGIEEALLALQEKTDGGYAVLLDRNGKFIAFPAAEESAKSISFEQQNNRSEEFLTAEQFAAQNPLFKPLAKIAQRLNQSILKQAQASPLFEATLAAKIDHDSYQINAEEAAFISAVVVDPLAQQTQATYLLSKTQIDDDYFLHQPSSVYFFHVPDTYWKLVIVQPQAEESRLATALVESLFLKIGGLILLLVLLAYILLRVGIVKPLTRMAANVHKADVAMAEGSLAAALPGLKFDVESSNEVAVLGQGFKRLLYAFSRAQKTIEQYNINLEKTVIERTEALKAKEVELVHLLDGMDEVHFRLGGDHLLQAVPPKLAALFGVSASTLEQQPLMNFFSNPDDFIDFIFKLERHDTVRAYEWRMVRSDSSVFWLSVNARAFRDEHGALQNIQGLLTDITGEKAMQDEKRSMQLKMEHVQRLESLGVLAGGIAHDFNNLLTAIMGNASLAELEMAPDSRVYGYMHQIQVASKRAAYLCSQMLAYSGKGQFIIKPIHLTKLIQEMVELLGVSIDKSIELDCQLMPDLPSIDGDEAQLQQVIMNLVINASEAVGGGAGKITCKTSMIYADRYLLRTSYLDEGLSEGDYVLLEVEDNGCGMSKEVQTHIFDPFFTTKFTGRGLGMSALLGIVRAHQGAIMVYSEVGEGTVFRVLLPVSAQQALAESDIDLEPLDAGRNLGHSRAAILLVDDEESVLNMTSTMIKSMGFKLFVASDGMQAVELYRQHAADIELVLLDYVMPKMNGHEVFRELLKINPDVRVLLSSGYTELKATESFKQADLHGFLQKPYDFGGLNKALKKALED